MTIKAGEIKGLLGERKETFRGFPRRDSGYNQHRQEIAQKPLGLDRNKIVQLFIQKRHDLGIAFFPPSISLYEKIAKLLIDNDHELIVVKE